MAWTPEQIAVSAFEKARRWQELAKADGTTIDLDRIFAYTTAYKAAMTNVPHPADGFTWHSEALDAGKRLVEQETNLTPEEVAALRPLVERIFGALSSA